MAKGRPRNPDNTIEGCCTYCGKPVTRARKDYIKYNNMFCSREHSYSWHKDQRRKQREEKELRKNRRVQED